MKDRILIGELHNHENKEVRIEGWVDTRRDHGKLIFIDLRDRSGNVQAVILPGNEQVHAVAEALRPEWVVRIEGVLNKRPEKMVNQNDLSGDIEIAVSSIVVLTKAHELPFDKDSELNLDTLLDYRPLTLRRGRERAIFSVQHEIARAYREALTERGFYEFQAPKIVGEDAEGGSSVFKLEYFKDKTAFLATSPQLYKQIMVGSLERVFSIGNVFRAEKHATTRHMSEYTSLDAEMGFIEDHISVMNVLIEILRHITDKLKDVSGEAFKQCEAVIPSMPKEIPSLKLREAQKLISKETEVDCTGERDLAPEHERWLSLYAKKEYHSDFIFITHFPIEKTAFYAYEDSEDLGYSKYFDLLFRGVEIASGGQRIHDYEMLIERIKQKGLNPKTFSFYLQAFKYGLPPHGGWGMGLERLTEKYLGIENVKEATLFPRDVNRIDTLLS